MTDHAVNPKTTMEDQLIHNLRFSNIEPKSLRDMVGIVVNLHKEGLDSTPMRLFPRGIQIDKPDGLWLRSFIKSDDIAKLLAALFKRDRFLISGVFVFPYGVIQDFEGYQVDVALGPSPALAAGEVAGV